VQATNTHQKKSEKSDLIEHGTHPIQRSGGQHCFAVIKIQPLEMNRLATINALEMVAVVMDLQKPQRMSCDRHSPFGTRVAEIICQHIAVELIPSIP